MPRKNNPDQVDMDNFHFDDGDNEKSDEELLDEWNTEGDEEDAPKKSAVDDDADAVVKADEDESDKSEDEDWDEDDEDDDEWDEDEEDDEDDES